MSGKNDVSIKKAIEELMQTRIFRNIAHRNDKKFANKLATWLIRYILIISSMKESLNTSLENILLSVHGEKFEKIVEVTEKTFNKLKEDSKKSDRYIW
ncbi:MAG: hypothetical protein V5A68_02000 [Candidatus Thermoplasmatota archaeon]